MTIKVLKYHADFYRRIQCQSLETVTRWSHLGKAWVGSEGAIVRGSRMLESYRINLVWFRSPSREGADGA